MKTKDLLYYRALAGDGGGSPTPTPIASPWQHIAHGEFTVSTTSTSGIEIGTIDCGNFRNAEKILYIQTRARNPRAGYLNGNDMFFIDVDSANGLPNTIYRAALLKSETKRISAGEDNSWERRVEHNAGSGIYIDFIGTNNVAHVYAKYSSSESGTIDDTFDVDIFMLDYPEGYPSVFAV